ncbi:hypothetical protein P3T36_002961 [Kitasatospora sp. MAP12-15]|uniref:hypothetical protein n=1 Tax=unclassified Kitasatospora TaxID=2633591 RepID=UPI0024762182|nr:hypothetical protein [Kitasatospora sp. MAP12-44]MDH6110631.1 hypothetical protein [Kitasatospora sp. MAP12-44]
MGVFEKFRDKADEALEQAKQAMTGHRHQPSDAMSEGGRKAAERMESGPDPLEQAESDMESEGGHEPM